MRARPRSAVFIMPMMWSRFGTDSSSPDTGRRSASPRCSASMSMSNSPKALEMLARLISSMMNT